VLPYPEPRHGAELAQLKPGGLAGRRWSRALTLFWMSDIKNALSTLPAERVREIDLALRARAARVVPGGMHGHLDAAFLPPEFPQFFERGEGCRVWDVDGNEYVDLMCSWGPNLLGYRHAEVDRAAADQAAVGDVLNGPTPLMVELAETLVEQVPHAAWAMFCKNGTDATSLGVVVARSATGRRKVLIARGSYHGIASWSTRPDAPGTTPEDHSNTVYFEYNDVKSVEEAVARAGADDIAAVVVTPIRHDIHRDLEAPTPEFARGLRMICDRIGAALLLDDIRCGLRLDMHGSWEPYGVRPDLSAWSKAVANGHALATLLGAEEWREGANRVFATGSFWMAAAPMAAALATLRILRETDGIETMRHAGERLQNGLRRQARSHGLEVTVSGPPQLPFLSFADDPNEERASVWTGECIKNGVYLHPYHNWFMSAAHDDASIDRALEGTDEAFKAVRDRDGAD
jgi:glutamate-1-semialdehyde 2,1-aminomutase